MSTTHRSFLSPPTVDRSILKVVVSLAATLGYRIESCDITQAFSQSTTMATVGQYVALPPPCVILSGLKWDGLIISEPDDVPKSEFAF